MIKILKKKEIQAMKGSVLHKVLISDFESLPADPVQLSELLLGNKKIVILFVVWCFLAT